MNLCACIKLFIWNGLATHWTIFKFSKWIEFCIINFFFSPGVYASFKEEEVENNWEKTDFAHVRTDFMVCFMWESSLNFHLIWAKLYFGRVTEKKERKKITTDSYIQTVCISNDCCVWKGRTYRRCICMCMCLPES